MIEFICFLIFIGILVVFWGISQEQEKPPKLENKKTQNKKTQEEKKHAITFEIQDAKKTFEQTETERSIQKKYIDELIAQDFDIKGDIFAQILRIKQGGQITQRNKRAGVYAIFSNINNRVYIGSSNNLYVRMKQHLFELRHKKHHSYRLQEDFDKFGEENFTFWVLEE